MLRRLIKRFVFLCIAIFLFGLLGVGVATLATHYLFQEPANVTWSRYLKPEFEWQRQKYPSIRWAFDILAPLFARSDPRDRFEYFDNAPPVLRPETWSSDLAGPRISAFDTPLLATSSALVVASVGELKKALRAAHPGLVILIEPGIYAFSGRSIDITSPGGPDQPIVLRARELGSVRLQFNMSEGFHVLAPFWRFENLIIEGVCQNHNYCDHAFHVVGKGHGVVIRNNWVVNFNAAIKINPRGDDFPDDGVLLNNAFINDYPRNTNSPVTPLDIVAASGWRVQKNIIADFAKNGGDHTSYGAFFKSAGENNIFEQNLVRCEWRHRGGLRIGFSFGNGGSYAAACRDRQCRVEQRNGIARSNVIMNCPNDVGIYLNKSERTQIYNNLLINTRGIDVRFPVTDAVISNNIIDGRILARDGAVYEESNNIISPLSALVLGKVSSDLFANPAAGDFRLRGLDVVLGTGTPIEGAGLDLCGQPYGPGAHPVGPIQYGLKMPCTPVIE